MKPRIAREVVADVEVQPHHRDLQEDSATDTVMQRRIADGGAMVPDCRHVPEED